MKTICNRITTVKATAYVFNPDTKKVEQRTRLFYVFGKNTPKKYRFALAEGEKLGKVTTEAPQSAVRYMSISTWNRLSTYSDKYKAGAEYKNFAEHAGYDVRGLFWNDSMTDTEERTEFVGTKTAVPSGMLCELERTLHKAEGYRYMSASLFFQNSYADLDTLKAVLKSKGEEAEEPEPEAEAEAEEAEEK